MTAVSEATLTLTVTLEEAQVLAQALDLLASDPGLLSDEWPNTDDNPELAALGLAAFDLSSRVHDLINAAVSEATSAAAPSWTEGLRAAMGR
jgi:hypothetical protein